MFRAGGKVNILTMPTFYFNKILPPKLLHVFNLERVWLAWSAHPKLHFELAYADHKYCRFLPGIYRNFKSFFLYPKRPHYTLEMSHSMWQNNLIWSIETK